MGIRTSRSIALLGALTLFSAASVHAAYSEQWISDTAIAKKATAHKSARDVNASTEADPIAAFAHPPKKSALLNVSDDPIAAFARSRPGTTHR